MACGGIATGSCPTHPRSIACWSTAPRSIEAHLHHNGARPRGFVFEERRAGQSKMLWHIVLEALARVWTLRFAWNLAPLRSVADNVRPVR